MLTPRACSALDHGYRFGWAQPHLPHVTQDLPRGIERQHSWIALLPVTYLKKDADRDPTDGQATLLLVQHGSLFVHIRRSVHFYEARQRSMLSSPAFLETHCLLAKGDMMHVFYTLGSTTCTDAILA